MTRFTCWRVLKIWEVRFPDFHPVQEFHWFRMKRILPAAGVKGAGRSKHRTLCPAFTYCWWLVLCLRGKRERNAVLSHCMSQPARVCVCVSVCVCICAQLLSPATRLFRDVQQAELRMAQLKPQRRKQAGEKGRQGVWKISLDPKGDYWNQCFSRVKATGAKAKGTKVPRIGYKPKLPSPRSVIWQEYSMRTHCGEFAVSLLCSFEWIVL